MSDTLSLWRHLFGSEKGLLALWSGERGEDGEIVKDTSKTKFFEYPQDAQKAFEWAIKESLQRGRETYFCAHLLTDKRRVKENAAAVHTLWGELDGEELPNGDLTPTAVVESSPGHYHTYWRLTDAIPPEEAERLNRRLAHTIGADPSGFDLTQILRVPDTLNLKYPDRPKVKILELRAGETFSPAELFERLPALPEEDRPTKEAPNGATSADEPPVVLVDKALETWHGEHPKYKENGEVDRSASLLKVARVLYDAGANRGVIENALAERDLALGWRCYTDRPDAEKQYAAIVDLLEKEGRNGSAKREKTHPIHSSPYRHGNGRNEDTNGYNHYPKKHLRAVSFAGRLKPPPQRFVVERAIPEGLSTSFYGGGGLAKSVNVLHLGLSVAFIGVDEWHGLEIATCPVTYLDFEMSEVVQLRRAKEIADGAGWPDVPKNFRYVEASGHDTADVFAFAQELSAEHGPSLVIVDSFGFSLQGEAERSADVLEYVRNYIQPLQDAGSSPLIIDHISKVVKGEKVEDKEAFGSVYKTNTMRSTIGITGHSDEDAGTVYATFTHRKNNVGPKLKPFTVITRFGSEEITFERSESVIRPPTEKTVEQLVTETVFEHGPMTNSQLAEMLDRSLKTVQNATGNLKRERVLEDTGERVEREAVLDLASEAGTTPEVF